MALDEGVRDSRKPARSRWPGFLTDGVAVTPRLFYSPARMIGWVRRREGLCSANDSCECSAEDGRRQEIQGMPRDAGYESAHRAVKKVGCQG